MNWKAKLLAALKVCRDTREGRPVNELGVAESLIEQALSEINDDLSEMAGMWDRGVWRGVTPRCHDCADHLRFFLEGDSKEKWADR